MTIEFQSLFASQYMYLEPWVFPMNVVFKSYTHILAPTSLYTQTKSGILLYFIEREISLASFWTTQDPQIMPTCSTALKTGMILSVLRNTFRNHCMWTRNVCRASHKCSSELYQAKREAYLNVVQKCLCLLWAENGQRQNVKLFGRQTNWNLEFFFGKHGCNILCTKEEQDHPTCDQLSVQKPALVPMELAAYTSVKVPSVLTGTYRFIAPTQDTGFSVLLTSARQCKTTHWNY